MSIDISKSSNFSNKGQSSEPTQSEENKIQENEMSNKVKEISKKEYGEDLEIDNLLDEAFALIEITDAEYESACSFADGMSWGEDPEIDRKLYKAQCVMRKYEGQSSEPIESEDDCIKENIMQTKTKSNLETKNLGVVESNLQRKLEISDLFGEFTAEEVKHVTEDAFGKKSSVTVQGKPGVFTFFMGPYRNHGQWDGVGFALDRNGLEVGEAVTSKGITAQRVKRLMAKKAFCFISKVHLAKKASDHKFDVKFRNFSSEEAGLAAEKLLGYKKPEVHELQDVLKLAKRANRFMSESQYVICEDKRDGSVWAGTQDSVHKLPRLPRIKVETPSVHDGNIMCSKEFMQYISSDFKVGSRWSTFSIYGQGAKHQIEDGKVINGNPGQKKGMGTIASQMKGSAEGWDIICFDDAKREHSLNGLFIMTIGGEAYTGHQSHTDLMLCNKSWEFSEWVAREEDVKKVEFLNGFKKHTETTDLAEVLLDGKVSDLEEGDPRVTLLNMRDYFNKLHGIKGVSKPTSSVMMEGIREKIDISMSPLSVDRAGFFLNGDEGKVATKYRREIVNSIDVEMIVYDERFWPKTPVYPEAKGREVVVTLSEDGVPMSYCSQEIWPEIAESTGGSDGDDRWQLWAFNQINKALKQLLGLNEAHKLSAWLFRQPDGPGDGCAVDVVLGISYLQLKEELINPIDLFYKIPSVKESNVFFTDIYDRITKVRELAENIEALEEADKLSRPEKKKFPKLPVDRSKAFKGFPTDVKISSKKFSSVEKVESAATETVSTKWWNYNGPSIVSIGKGTNLNSVSQNVFLDGKGNTKTKLYLARMLKKGYLEKIIDWDNMGKGDPEELRMITKDYYDALNSVNYIEQSHLVGHSKDFKSRVSSKNGIYIPALWAFHSKSFTWPKRNDYGKQVELSPEFKAKVTEVANTEGNYVVHGHNTFMTVEGKIAIAELCGLKVYKGELTKFYDGISDSYNRSNILIKAIALKFQLRWYDEFLKGNSSPEEVNNLMKKMVGSKFGGLIADIYSINSKFDLMYDTKAEGIVNLIKSQVAKKDMEEFFLALTWADIFQMRIDYNGKPYSGLISRGKYEGWLAKARRGYQTCVVLQKAADANLHPSEIKGSTQEAIDLVDTGFITEAVGDDTRQVAFLDAWKLRNLLHIPKGKAKEYTPSGEAVRDNSWVIKGKTFMAWYISSYRKVAEVLHSDK